MLAPLEIEIEGVGTYRLPNIWEQDRIKRMRPRSRQLEARLALPLGMTVAQFRRLPQQAREAVRRAYLSLTAPPEPSRLQGRPEPCLRLAKGVHRTDEEKAAIGRYLLEVKAGLPRGHFGPWLDDHNVSKSLAHEAMKLARIGG